MQKKNWFGPIVLILIGAVTYLPMITKIGYLNDDWYLMYDGYVGGAGFFHNIYSIDRPLRGYLMQAAFSLFGMEPLNYHLCAFLFRVLSALGLLWICNQVWSKRASSNLLIAIFFLIYPGFLSQTNPIDYQSQIFSLACGMFSVALTVCAIRTEYPGRRWVYTILSIALGWIYLGLVEYFIGFEVLRCMIVGVLFWRDTEKSIPVRVTHALRAFIPFLASAAGFLTWRLFFFEAERKATDVSLQLSSFFDSPLTGLWWLNYLVQDFFKVTLVAWALPLNNIAFSLRLRDAFIGIGLATLAALILWAMFRWEPNDDQGDPDQNEEFAAIKEKFWVSIAAIFAGLIPVILVNRHVILPDYSRYALAPSVGAVILLSLVIERISMPVLKKTTVVFFVMVAVLTHYGNSVKAANETAATRDFWWQVSWRAPAIKDGVTLIASYPNGSLSEDYFIWGPANFIYHPEKQLASPLAIKLPAVVLDGNAVLDITTRGGVETPLRRGNYLERDFDNVLVLIQSSENGCVRIINGNSPELSANDSEKLFLVAPFSGLENVQTEGGFQTPPTVVFGREPEHGWCFYYQKADLARQQGEWKKIPLLLKEALDAGYYPEDGVEWMPFLQAYAMLGDVEHVRSTAKLISIDKFVKVRACGVMTDFMNENSVNEEVEMTIGKIICNK